MFFPPVRTPAVVDVEALEAVLAEGKAFVASELTTLMYNEGRSSLQFRKCG
jgi:hypothetical protein